MAWTFSGASVWVISADLLQEGEEGCVLGGAGACGLRGGHVLERHFAGIEAVADGGEETQPAQPVDVVAEPARVVVGAAPAEAFVGQAWGIGPAEQAPARVG